MKKENEKMESVIIFHINETDKSILKMVAKKKRISLSAYIRMIVLSEIEIKITTDV